MLDISHRGAAQLASPHYAHEIPFDKGYAGALHRHVGARSHGDPDLRLSQRRGIVNAVARHGDEMTLILKALDLFTFVLRQHLGYNVFDSQLTGHCLGRCPAISS